MFFDRCTNRSQHSTCQHKAWDGGKIELLCTLRCGCCRYSPDYIHFDNVPDDTIMFCGDIESAREFKTKAEWIAEYNGAFPTAEFEGDWYTTVKQTAKIELRDLINDIEESGEMYEDWYSNVLPTCEGDEIILAGIKRLNEIMSEYPTYFEGKKVIF